MPTVRRIIRTTALSALLLLAVASGSAQTGSTASDGVQASSGPCLMTNTDHDWKCAHYRRAEVAASDQPCSLTIRGRVFRWSCTDLT